MSGHVLVVDDDQDMCRLVAAWLGQRGFRVTWRTSAAAALDVVDHAALDAVVTDLEMGATNGLELCERIVAARPDLPVTVLTAHGSFDTAVAAIRAGAYDFLTKPAEPDGLAAAVTRAVQHRSRGLDAAPPLEGDTLTETFGELATADAGMRRVLGLLRRVSSTDAAVLIAGESGTGKELVARALHREGRRHDGPLIAVNCAAMPPALLESELFGHVRGAFTDAQADRTGLFLQADGGTLFLDEIGELPLPLQPKLLRALQERAVRPVGGNRDLPFDARVICATNCDLEAAVEAGRFRRDLFFRLDVIRIDLPPLRERGDDVLLLAQRFLAEFAGRNDKPIHGVSAGVAARLRAHAWPGNVRELRNSIERAVAVARTDRLAVADLPERLQAIPARGTGAHDDTDADLVPLEELERSHILRVLERVDHNRKRAAAILGLDRKTLYRRLQRYALHS